MTVASSNVSETKYHLSLSSTIMGHDPLILRHASPGDGGMKGDFTSSGEMSDSDDSYLPESVASEVEGQDVTLFFSGNDNSDNVNTSADSDESAIACQNPCHGAVCKNNSPRNITRCLKASVNKGSGSEAATQSDVPADVGTLARPKFSKHTKNACCKSIKNKESNCGLYDEPTAVSDSQNTAIKTNFGSEGSTDTDSSVNSAETSSKTREALDIKATFSAGSTGSSQITDSSSH